jgi:hypothetical protein
MGNGKKTNDKAGSITLKRFHRRPRNVRSVNSTGGIIGFAASAQTTGAAQQALTLIIIVRSIVKSGAASL